MTDTGVYSHMFAISILVTIVTVFYIISSESYIEYISLTTSAPIWLVKEIAREPMLTQKWLFDNKNINFKDIVKNNDVLMVSLNVLNELELNLDLKVSSSTNYDKELITLQFTNKTIDFSIDVEIYEDQSGFKQLDFIFRFHSITYLLNFFIFFENSRYLNFCHSLATNLLNEIDQQFEDYKNHISAN